MDENIKKYRKYIKDAEKAVERENYNAASDSFYEAAKVAKEHFKNDFLASSLIMQHYLALIYSPGQLTADNLEQLLNSIDKLLKLNLDDRLPEKLEPIRDLFEVIYLYFMPDKERFKEKMNELKQKAAVVKPSYINSLANIILEIGILHESIKEIKDLNQLKKN